MMSWRCLVRLAIVVAALLGVTARAQDTCPPTPETYEHLEYGDTRFAIEETCRGTFTQDEQFFVAGVAQTLWSDCKLPRDRDGRALVGRFLKAASLALELRKPGRSIHDAIPAQPDRAAAFTAGQSMMEDIRCNGPEAALLSRGIVIYLKRTARVSRFLPGCVEFYAGQYTEKECRCIADSLRSVVHDIDQRFFDKELIKQSIHESPSVAFPLMLKCGVASY